MGGICIKVKALIIYTHTHVHPYDGIAYDWRKSWLDHLDWITPKRIVRRHANHLEDHGMQDQLPPSKWIRILADCCLLEIVECA